MVSETHQPGPQPQTPRRGGEPTRLGEILPQPDETTRPVAGLCAECGGQVEPIWLPVTKRPRWFVSDLCKACAETRAQKQEQERHRKRAEETLRERIRRAGLGSPHRASRTFGTFEQVAGTELALARARMFAARMSDVPDMVHRGLLFVGLNGCGKTHLALGILHEVMASDIARSGLFVEFADYLAALRRSFRRATGDDSEDPEWVRYAMFEVELLVLDDIGAAASSRAGWDAEEMCRLLNHRIEAGRPIVATADVGPEELADRLGQRVVSRLYEACEMVKIEAGDYRRKGEQGG